MIITLITIMCKKVLEKRVNITFLNHLITQTFLYVLFMIITKRFKNITTESYCKVLAFMFSQLIFQPNHHHHHQLWLKSTTNTPRHILVY